MGATTTAVRRFAGGVPCRAALVPSDASGCASGKKQRCFAPASRDSSVCLAGVEKLCVPSQKRKMADSRRKTDAGADTKIFTVGGETPINPAQDLLHKRLAAELDAVHRILKKAELISRGACKGGAPTAGKKERFLASQQRSEPMEKDGGNAPAAKKRKISTLVVQKQIHAPRMSPEQRNQKFGEESKNCKIAEDSKGEVIMEMEQVEEDVDICGLSPIIEGQIMVTAAQKLSEPASGMAGSTAQAESGAGESGEAKKVHDVQRAAPKPVVSMAGLIYKAKISLELKTMEKTVLPDESIHPRDLQRFCIAEYGRPSLMQQLGLFLKDDA